jgi:hypothetical protein
MLIVVAIVLVSIREDYFLLRSINKR